MFGYNGYPGFSPFSYNPQNQFQNQYQNQFASIKGRAVSSVDEVKGAMIDLDGSVFVFPDASNGCIYTKQIDKNGAAVIERYIKENMQTVETEKDKLGEAIIGLNSLMTNIDSKLGTLIEEVNKNGYESNAVYGANNANATTGNEQSFVQESSRNGKWKR